MKLRKDERELFGQVARAAFLNPFSDERTELDVGLADLGKTAPKEAILPRIVKSLKNQFERMGSEGRTQLSEYQTSDRRKVEPALLFLVFHEHLDEMDTFIARQLEGEPLKEAPFTRSMITRLSHWGISTHKAAYYIALFYQMRRAFYFINHSIIGSSQVMKQLRCQLWNQVFTHDTALYDQYFWNRMEDFSTLLIGETGTGKGTAAAAIGKSGFIPFDPKTNRFQESFLACYREINLSAIPENLLEAQLFGYKKGAFTGAIESFKGLLSTENSYSTIFLDEIGEVAPHIQVKLLNVIQDRVFTPMGSHTPQHFRGRIIAATNQDLLAMRKSGQFREDFYYRLCSDVIKLPALRERIAGDPLELDHLLSFIVKKLAGVEAPAIESMCRKVIKKQLGLLYPWPGNVRELEQCVRRIVLQKNYESTQVSSSNVPEELLQSGWDARTLIGWYCDHLLDKSGSLDETARITRLDPRTVKKHISLFKQDTKTER